MTETLVLGAILAAGSGAAVLGALVWGRMNSYRRVPRRAKQGARGPGASELDEAYSLDRYQPMVRLFAGDDADFFQRQIHCPEIAAQWERSQRRIVRLFLRDLAADFQHLHQQARTLVAQSPEQYAGLVPLLLKQQIAFWRALIWIEVCLSLTGAGVPKINLEPLVGAVEAMRREISHATAAA